MKVLIAVDKFKGSLTGRQAAAAIADGIKRVGGDVEVHTSLLADGGEGTLDALITADHGRTEAVEVAGPLPGMRVTGYVGYLRDGTAVVELASAAGLSLLPPDARDPMRTTTYGAGELINAAIKSGTKKIIFAIGGSATCDGGLGIIQACGGLIKMMNGKSYSARDRKLTGADLGKVLSIAPFAPSFEQIRSRTKLLASNLRPAVLNLNGVDFVIAADVGNPLCGPDGTARMFAPQKGATAEQVEQLEADLEKFVRRLNMVEIADEPGTGAAGGAGFAMKAFFGGQIVSGASLVLQATRLEEQIAHADLVITGEGRLDAQTLCGKGPLIVANAARDSGVPCVALAGSILGDEAALVQFQKAGFTSLFSLTEGPVSLQEAVEQARPLLTRLSERVMRLWLSARSSRT